MAKFEELDHGGFRTLVWVPNTPPPHRGLLFLHGRGESGTDPSSLQSGFLGKALEAAPERWPFLVVMPQKPRQDVLWPDHKGHLEETLNRTAGAYSVDTDRCAITGLSQGGHGAMALARGLPWKFRAVAAVCGWGDPATLARDFSDLPLWLFHGDRDKVVPVEKSLAIHDQFLAMDKQVRLTVYPGVGHDCWDRAYADPELADWLCKATVNGSAKA